MVALYRPGPMELIPDYIARKHGEKEIRYLHPKLEPILRNTYGIAVYQEQILQIARELAGFSYGEADILRKAIGKKIKTLLEEQKVKFVERAVAAGTSKKIAESVFDFIEPFASYGFNRSHAACYATIAYQTAWLKANYPLEYMSALLTSERNDVERIAFLIEETRKMGIEVLPPDVNESFAFFSAVPAKNQIRFGLLAIKNVGEGIVASIIQERKGNGPYLAIQNFVTRVATKDLNKKSLESLIKSGALDDIGERNQMLINLDAILEYSKQLQKNIESSQIGLFESAAVKIGSLRLSHAEPAPQNQKLLWEKELLGLYLSSHPLEEYKEKLEKQTKPIADITNNSIGRAIKAGGLISNIKPIVTKTGSAMAFAMLQDFTGKIELVIFPDAWEKIKEKIQEDIVAIISGRVDARNGDYKIICNEIKALK